MTGTSVKAEMGGLEPSGMSHGMSRTKQLCHLSIGSLHIWTSPWYSDWHLGKIQGRQTEWAVV